MSDSEDDFMSDKFLVDAAPHEPKTYSARRSAAELKSLRVGQAKNKRSLKEEEEVRRREGLNTSLFDRYDAARPSSSSNGSNGSDIRGIRGCNGGKSGGEGGSKAMDMMMKMGWSVGEGLGKRRSASPERRPAHSGVESGRAQAEEDEGGAERGGLGSSRSRARAEPLRISMWAGRRGLTARSPTPPPLPDPRRDPDNLDPSKRARLDAETRSFRARRGGEFTAKETEKKQVKSRDTLVHFDEEAGIKFHPLHVIPQDPLAMPRPLLELIYPSQFPSSPTASRSPSPSLTAAAAPLTSSSKKSNMSAAEKMREQMRRDMLSNLGEDDEGMLQFGKTFSDPTGHGVEGVGEVDKNQGVDWTSMVSGVKRVLAMEPADHLAFLVSQLRNEYLYCFWCSYRYSSWEEMNAPGGCPGEDEDDH